MGVATDLEALLERLREAARSSDDPVGQVALLMQAALRELDQRIAEARAHGRSWDDIAEQVGLTRQAAWSRWRHIDKEKERQMKTWACPYCSTVATYRHNLKKHLMGTHAYGGHEIDEAEADRLLDARE